MTSVEQVREVVNAGNVAEGRRLAHELVKWFPGHADYMDASLAQWMVKQSTGGAPIVLRRGVANHQLGQDPQQDELDRRLDDLEREGPVGIPADEVLGRLHSRRA
jgi:hypothetical protein